MKHFFLLLLSFTFCFVLQAETTMATSYAGGTGTEADPYQIETLAQLRLLSETSADWSKSFVLTADIDATDTKTWNSGSGFSPIGNSTTKFTGSFEGNFFVIDDISINRPTEDYIGLFGYTDIVTVKNIGLTNCTAIGKGSVGALVGYANLTTVEHCFASGEITASDNYCAGLVGYSYGTSIKQCYTNCTVHGYKYTGGIAGYAAVDGEIEDCSVYGTTSSSKGEFGGIVSRLYSGSIKNCYVSGYVSIAGSNRGAIMGSLNTLGTITTCYYDKTINSTLGAVNNAANVNVTALTTTDFATASNFAFDFTNTWKIFIISEFDEVARPYLQWMSDYIVAFNVGANGDAIQGKGMQFINEGESTQAVTAIGNAGYVFKEWQGTAGNVVSTDNPLIITSVTQDSTLTAIFQVGFKVNFNGDENGTIAGSTFQGVVAGADASAVTATANTGYHFDEWRNVAGDSITNINPLSISNVTQDTALTAVFEIDTFSVGFTAAANGIITGPASQNITYGSDADEVIATANAGYHFDEWRNVAGDSITNINPLTITNVTQDSALIAVFEITQSTITFEAGENGTLSITGDKIMTINDVVECDFTPNDGYIVSKVYLDGTIVPYSGNKYTFKNVVANHTLKVEFEEFDGVLTLNPQRDAYVYFNDNIAERANTNFGESSGLSISYQYNYKNEWQSLLNFSYIQELLESVNITDAFESVVGVKLNLYCNTASTHGGDNAFNVYWYNENWNETEVTWNNAPALDSDAPYVTVAKSTFNTQNYSINISKLLKEKYRKEEGEAGFRLKFDDKSSEKNVTLCSKENSSDNFPALKIYIKGYYHPVNFSSDGNGSISGDTAQIIKIGSDATEITAIDNEYYHFDEWRNAAGDSVTNINPLTITNVVQDSALTAVFEINHDTITFEAGENGTLSIMGDRVVTINDVVECDFTPNDGYIVSKVYLDGAIVPYSGNKYTFKNVVANHVLKVEFEEFDGVLILNPDKDAYIYTNGSISSREDENFGIKDNLYATSYPSDESYTQSIVHFSNIQSVLDAVNITDANNSIIGVKLNLYHYPDKNHVGDNAFNVYWYNKNWNETAVTWNNAPAIDTDAPFVAVPASTSDTQDYSINISDLFSAKYQTVDGGAGFRLKLVDNTTEKRVELCSKENSSDNFPALQIYFKGYYYPVNFTSTGNGSISGDAAQLIKTGSDATEITALPDEGYHFVKWQDTDGELVSTDNPFTLTNVTSDTEIYAVFDTETAINEPASVASVNILPNPTTGMVNIPLESGVANLTVYSVTGKQVYSDLDFKGGSVDLSNLPQGLYVVKLNSGDKISIGKLIKK